MNRAQHQMMKIVQKIPFFDGLTPEQAQRLIKISKFRQYSMGDTIYGVGEQGDEMLVLIKGRLNVLSATGQTLGEVQPGQSTGEMGVFTGHRRSATIVALDDCAGLGVTRDVLYQAMDQDPLMKGTILQNVVTELSNRLADANSQMDVLNAQVSAAPDPDPEPEPEPEPDEEEPSEDEASAAEDVIAEAAGESDDDMPEAEDIA